MNRETIVGLFAIVVLTAIGIFVIDWLFRLAGWMTRNKQLRRDRGSTGSAAGADNGSVSGYSDWGQNHTGHGVFHDHQGGPHDTGGLQGGDAGGHAGGFDGGGGHGGGDGGGSGH